jgi:hypothetical protein
MLMRDAQICAHLAPRDLLALSRASRGFRKLLLAKPAPWRNALIQDGPTPPPPAGVDARAWAHLLFGDALCHASARFPPA